MTYKRVREDLFFITENTSSYLRLEIKEQITFISRKKHKENSQMENNNRSIDIY